MSGSKPASPTGGIAPTNPLRCPIHHLPDCSPLLNGCSLVIELATYPRGTVDAAIEGVRDTYTQEGVEIWWGNWLRESDEHRPNWLFRAMSLTGQVAT